MFLKIKRNYPLPLRILIGVENWAFLQIKCLKRAFSAITVNCFRIKTQSKVIRGKGKLIGIGIRSEKGKSKQKESARSPKIGARLISTVEMF